MVNRKVLLVVKDVEDVSDQIDALLHFFSTDDKLILAVYQENTESDWPFKMYDLGWPLLKEPNLAKKLHQSCALKKRSRAKWIESSSFIDLAVIHRSLFQDFAKQSEVRTILEIILCPIFLMDEHQTRFDEIYFSYNGTGSSFDKIKQLTYLFHPHFDKSLLNLVVKVSDKALNLENCVYDYLRLHKRHFAISRYFDEDYDQGIESLLDESSSPLVVCSGERHQNIDQFTHYSDDRSQPSSMFLL